MSINVLLTSSSIGLLTTSQSQALSNLDEKLKDVVTEQLLSHHSTAVEVAQKTLDIIRETESSFQRDQFLIHLLLDGTDQVLDSIGKILSIVNQGYFKTFLEDIDKPSTSSVNMFNLIHEFHVITLPNLIAEKKHASTLGKRSKSNETRISKLYDWMQESRYYFQFLKYVNEFLMLIKAENALPQEVIQHLLHTLKYDFKFQFQDDERLTLAQLVLQILDPSSKEITTCYTQQDIDEFLYQAHQLKLEAGEEILGYYFYSLKRQPNNSLEEKIRGSRLLNLISKNPNFCKFLNDWKIQDYSWDILFSYLEGYVAKTGLNESLFYEDLDSLLLRFKLDSTVSEPLSDENLKTIKAQYEIVNRLCKKYQHLSFNELINHAHEIREKAYHSKISEDERLELIALGRLSIRIYFGIYAYNTQILALLGVLIGKENRQAQVKTGEGKSVIVALWTFTRAMECHAVDNITSTRSLAIRDQSKYFPFFKRCGIKTSHICYDNKEPSHFRAQVLYAPAFDFEFAWMGDQLHRSGLYEAKLTSDYVLRNFDCVCVDESDNLLIDSARSGARLSFPAEVSYDHVYAPILTFISDIFNTNEINFSEENWYLLEFRRILSNKSRNLQDQDDENVILKFLEQVGKKVALHQTVSTLKAHLLIAASDEEKAIYENLSFEQLILWLFSAYHALYELKEEVDYIVKSKKGNSARSIQIVDLKTGRISEKSRWSNGIHEFLEIKHDIPVKKESLTPISLTHSVFYGFYQNITAFTGTAERYQTKQIYGIQSFDVPPHLPLKRIDLPPIIKPTEAAYYNEILFSAKEMIEKGRPILVLCKTIQDSIILSRKLHDLNIGHQILNEIQEELEHVVIARAGLPGYVTIATNTAGRGTDIILSKQSLKNGGLHVLLTFYPETEREEGQAIGRAGRQGQPGSSQMIFHREHPDIAKLIQSQKNNVSNEMIMKLLKLERRKNEEEQAKEYHLRADLERYRASLTQQFFDQLQNWSDLIEKKGFLEAQSQRLCAIKLRRDKSFNFESLQKNDLNIANECVRLLQSSNKTPIDWKIFLDLVVKRIRAKVLNDWSLLFYSKTEECLSPNNESMDEQKNNFKALFDTHKEKWEKYLSPEGIFVYLKDVTSINLYKK